MSHTLRVRAGLTLTLLLTAALATTRANTPSPKLSPEQSEQAQRLVRKLGDRSFKVREAASDELVTMGRAVEPVLREGLTYPDAEIRQRCKRLLPLALSYDLEKHIRAFLADKDGKNETVLAGWPRFKDLAGNDNGARLLFVDMHRSDGEFMDALGQNPASLTQRYQARCHEFMNGFNFNWGRVTVTPEQVAVLLFAAFEPKLKSDMQAQMFLSNALNNLSYQPNGKGVLRDNVVVRKLLVSYISKTDGSWSYNNLMLLANLDLREEGLAIAKKLIAAPGAIRDGHSKAMAISIIGKMGTKENIPDLVAFLDDKSSIGAFRFNNNPQITTQLRDVALANLAKLSGHNLADYSFAYLKQFPQGIQMDIHTSPTMWGFSDEATRTASIKKWQDWWEKENAKSKK